MVGLMTYLRRGERTAAAEKHAKTAAVARKATITMLGFKCSAKLMSGPTERPWLKAAAPSSPYLPTLESFNVQYAIKVSLYCIEISVCVRFINH